MPHSKNASSNSLLVMFSAMMCLSVGCVSTHVTPERIAAVTAVPEKERQATLRRWEEAVALCNRFLDSPQRKTLPPGKVLLTEDGMRWVTGTNDIAVDVRCNGWGDAVVFASMAAQERSDGFVVGSVNPHRHRAIDNSFFRGPWSGLRWPHRMSSLILHEITHMHYEQGTVSFWKGTRYYLEAVFLLRYRKHSMEALPYATSDEFRQFLRTPPKEE